MNEVDNEYAVFQQQMAAAAEADVQKKSMENFGGFTDTMPGEHDPVSPWLSKLPKNVGIGLIDAAVNAADQIGRAMKATETGKPEDVVGVPKEGAEHATVAYNAMRQHVIDFRNGLTANNTTGDEMTQAIAQYAIPAMGFMKLIGGLQGANLLGTAGRVAAVEAATASTILDPHSQRFADVLSLARETEGRIGAAMNTLAPDGSLLNSYINWMTDRTNESDFEGTVKNVIDNIGMAGLTAGLFTTGAKALKMTWKLPGYIGENLGPGPVGRNAQRGSIGVANNASGESSASLEAINRAAQEQAAGLQRMRINADGTVQPLLGPDAVDAKAYSGQLIVQRGVGDREWTVLSKGSDVKDAHVTGRLNAAKSNLDAAMKGETK